MIFLRAVWSWLKRNWKWVVFPIGLLSFIMAVVTGASALKRYADPPPDLDETTREALKKLRSAELERNRKVAELEVEHKERLRQLSGDQQTELEELQDQPLEEVVEWFNQL